MQPHLVDLLPGGVPIHDSRRLALRPSLLGPGAPHQGFCPARASWTIHAYDVSYHLALGDVIARRMSLPEATFGP